MKIISYTLTQDAIALHHPFVTALRRVDAVEFLLLELVTDTGLRAKGSAPATEAITGETLESIRDDLETVILPLLLKRVFDLTGLLETFKACTAGSSAKAVADMALFSLAAQSAGVPLFAYLGGQTVLPIQTAVTISLDTPQQMLDQAKEAHSKGRTILKIKVGRDDGLDAERIRLISAALPGARLLVDANQAWDAAQSRSVIDAVASLNIALIEQPVPARDLTALAQITRDSPIPILADEAVFSVEDARGAIAVGAADLINVKLMKCGGISGALEIIDLCREHGMQCMLGSMLEGPVSITAALHLAIACRDTLAWIDLDSPLLYADLPGDLPFEIKANTYSLHV